MAPQVNKIVHTEEEQYDNWVLVRGRLPCERMGAQIEDGNIPPTQEPAVISDDEALSDIGCKPTHTNCCHPTIGVVLHSIKSSDANPTPDPKVESADSTATGLTFSAPEDVSSEPQPRTPAEDNCPSQPLTRANLGPNSTPGLIRDIQAWVDGDLVWLRVAVGCDEPSDMPFERGTTCHSSDGSLDFVFTPAQPASFGRDALAIGTVFEHEPYTQAYSSDMELDEA